MTKIEPKTRCRGSRNGQQIRLQSRKILHTNLLPAGRLLPGHYSFDSTIFFEREPKGVTSS